METIILSGINHAYGKKQVLNGIDMRVEQGSIYGLLGPSGCGKTTVVKIMAGILEASAGTAEVLGQTMPQLAMLSQIGYMAQSDALYPTLTAWENLLFWGSLYGMKRDMIAKRAEEVLALVGLEQTMKQPVQSFSGGMKRRLSLAVALLHRPPVLILDEPTVGIDPLLRRNIWRALHDLADSGATIVLTTHVMDEADKCSRLAMMRGGRIIAEDEPAKLQAAVGAASIEEAFIYYGGDQDEG